MGNSLLITIWLVLVGLVVANSATEVGIGGGAPPNSAPSAAECSEERRLGLHACKFTLITHFRPSGKCCRRIRETHTGCVCPLITPRVADMIDLDFVLRTLERCGREVPRNFKCGSITTPPE